MSIHKYTLLKGKKRVFHWNEIPEWMRDNIFITDGYRPQTNNYTDCFKSLFYLHNESVNVYSHLIAFFIFVGFGLHFLWAQPFLESLTVFDYAYFFLFLVGALICLGFSSSFHCFACHSEKVAAAWNRCDYAGITFLTVGSFFPLIYYGFYCHQHLQAVYLVCIVTLGSITATVTLMKHFRTPAYRWVRTSLFLSLGLFGLIPTFHQISLYGLDTSYKALALSNTKLMAGSYITGALIYGCRIPERILPGRFNYFGASHQIFHFFVIIALFSHYLGVLNAMAFWHDPENKQFCTTLP